MKSIIIIVNIMIALMMTVSVVSSKAITITKDEALSAKEQNIVTIAAFTANGDLNSLSKALHQGLDAGLTVSEVKEVLVHLYAYAGFPRSLNALHTFMAVLKERKDKGINDEAGKEANPLPTNKTKLEFGTEIQTRLVGAPIKGAIYEFAPAIDQFLKEHLFGDIFGRDVLDFRTREIATISALASLGGAENQLRSHFRVGMHNGITKEQLHNLVSIIQTKVGNKEGSTASAILQALLNPDTSTNTVSAMIPAAQTNPSQNAFPKGEKIISNNFVGSAWLQMIVSRDSVFNTQVASVTFEPGARTNWHYHPSGQILVITDGSAYYQEKGKPKQILSKGQVVKCPPGVTHWHGAAPGSAMTHMVVSPNLQMGHVVWLQKVTDEAYEGSR